ncbi:vesicle coat component, partial [Ascosphaera atra]
MARKSAPGPAAATAAASRYAAPPPPPPAAAAQMRRPASLSPPPPPPQIMPQVPHAPPKPPTPAMTMTAEEEGMYKPLAQDVAPAAAAPAPGGHVTSQTSSTRTSPRSHRRYEPQPVQQQLAASPPPQQASPPLAATNPYEPPSSMVAPLLGGPPAGAPPRSHPPGEPHPSLPDRSLTQSTSRMPQAAAATGPSYLHPPPVASPPRSAPGAQARTASPVSWPPQQPQQQPQPKPSQPELEFIAPTDGQELDPLERWKGAPVFKFGFNGLVASTFPKHVPRYATGHMVPRIMPTVGEVRVRSINSITDTLNPSVKFPGPLRSAKAKKDAVAWMSSMIAVFEAPEAGAAAESETEHREKILLWKVVRLLVEHDGVLNGTPACDAAIRDVFASTTGGPADDLSRLDPASFARPEPADPSSVSRVREFLLAGDSEKAIWEAVDHRLWGHAMLLSSTLENRAIWKQVASEFIRREVNVARGVTESLGAAYEVFAGNAEESVDQLVPPSARAGLQMVSKDARGPDSSRTGLEGLEKWQETLQLILSNRTSNDYQAIVSLARLLASFGRTAASHVCAIFARCALARSAPTWNIANGVDDGNALFVLLGVDH